MNRKAKGIAIGTLLAGAMGYLAGILTAPKSGRETRESIRDARDIGIAQTEKQLKKLHTELNQLLGKAAHITKYGASTERDEALEGEVIGRATRARQKTREILSALHDGNANDKDLAKAVSEATKAIKSVRTYLRK
jgi:gas vesicle protein